MRRWACLILVAGAGCASIQGESEYDRVQDPGTDPMHDGGAPDDIGDDGDEDDEEDGEPDTSDGSDGAFGDGSDGTPGGDGATADGNPGDGDMSAEPDAGMPEEPVRFSCASPQELAVPAGGGVVRASANTTGAPDSQSARCPALFALSGPDHVYSFTMPFAGEVEPIATPAGLLNTYQPSVYLLRTCGDAATTLACNYAGNVPFGQSGVLPAGQKVFLYVDSGAVDIAGVATPAQGAYNLELALRKLVGDGEGCGDARTDAHCTSGLSCVPEGTGKVCRTPRCGDGTKTGSEQCDDGNTTPGDGCSDTCTTEVVSNGDTCATARGLVFTSNGSQRVARLSGTTVGLADDGDRACAGYSDLGDVFYTFTLTASSSVTVSVTPQSGFDPVVALYSGQCSALSQVRCRDATVSQPETFTESLAAGTYTLVVDGYDQDGAFDLSVTLAP